MNNTLFIPHSLKQEISPKGVPTYLYLIETDKWRPTEIIHYFDQDSNYLESKLKTEICNQYSIVVGDYPYSKSNCYWKPNGKGTHTEVFNINDHEIPQNPKHLIFWNAVKEGFAKRDPFVKTGNDCGNFSFYVQYLVK